MTTALIAAFVLGLIFGVFIGVAIGFTIVTKVIGIPKGYKIGTVTFKKIQED